MYFPSESLVSSPENCVDYNPITRTFRILRAGWYTFTLTVNVSVIRSTVNTASYVEFFLYSRVALLDPFPITFDIPEFYSGGVTSIKPGNPPIGQPFTNLDAQFTTTTTWTRSYAEGELVLIAWSSGRQAASAVIVPWPTTTQVFPGCQLTVVAVGYP